MSTFKWNLTPKQWLFVWATLGVLAGTMLFSLFSGPSESAPPPPADAPAPRAPQEQVQRTISPEAINAANEQLKWAHGQTVVRLDQHFAPVEELFAAAQSREFSERCLSWKSKWLLLKDKIYESGEHTELIESEFRSCIFDEAELERLLEQCTRAYLQEVGSIDGEMLVRLRVDLESLPSGAVPGFDAGELHSRYGDALQRAVSASRSDVLATVERETVSFIVSEVITAAMVQLGISGGILTAGATSGWATFGAGLVVGLLVDFAIQQYSDPVSELALELDGRLEDLKNGILYGYPDSPGLMFRLRDFAESRALARRDAIQEMFTGFAAR